MSKRDKTPLPEASELWRTDEQRVGGEAFAKELAREFPAGAAELDGASRREFIQLVGASLALAGVGTLAGCKDPPNNVLAYNAKPLDVTPGKPLHYATALTHGGYASGVLVTAYEGRPTKIEGNPEHPINRGTSTVADQATILSLYDPDRAKLIKKSGRGATWKDFCNTLTSGVDAHKADGGAGVAFLVEPSGSALLAAQEKRIKALLPKARWFAHAPVAMDNVYEGARIAFGRPLETQLDLSKSRVIVSLDADFLGGWPMWMHAQRQFADRRTPGPDMSRLYVAEAALSCTGISSDHRLRLRASDVGQLARALHAAISGGTATLNDAKAGAWIKAVAKDLTSAGADGVVLVGPRQPAAVHALAHAINAQLKANAIAYTAPVLPQYETLETLAGEMSAGHVDTLFMTAWNPVFSAPADVPFRAALGKVTNTIYLAMHEDETAAQASWVIPRAHELEAWGDARAVDGTVTLQQPLLQPLFGGYSTAELFSALLGEGGHGGYQLLRASWSHLDDTAWQHNLQRGTVDNSATPREAATLQAAAVTGAADKLPAAPPGIELNFVPDYKVYDGRHANNAWLQELPDPATKLTWDNALIMSAGTAEKLGVAKGDFCSLKVRDRELRVQALPWHGHADDSVTLALGYGRNSESETSSRAVGSNAYVVRSASARWIDAATVTRIGKGPKLAITQEHWQMDGRPIALEVPNRALGKKRLPIIEETAGPVDSMYKPHEYPGLKWAMAIDLNRCTGCSACVTACQAENNIPVVGRDMVLKSREMHWLRIDAYFKSHKSVALGHDAIDPDPESVVFQPLACVHCEKAPCEYVCPVEATAHSDEGLNEMIYNRCVGTRYCSNNCPYKVRRFNYLDYHPFVSPEARMAMNPDVTVRSRGVMEKCTYCVQRIEGARIEARVAGRPYAEGDVVVACQQACPSRAITFGSLHDASSAVSKLHDDPRAYDLLHELGTRPRTAYLARVKNTNPELDNG